MNIAQKSKIILVVCLLWALPLATLPHVAATPRAAAPAPTTANTAEVKMTVSENYGKLPLSFEPNMGQSAKAVKFLSRGNGYTVFLTATEAVFSLRRDHRSSNAASRARLRMKLTGANEAASVEGQQPLPGKVNYMIGNDRNAWHTGIPTFRHVLYSNTRPGVDMVWYGTQNHLEYDFVIKPGAPSNVVSQIRLSFSG